MVFRISLRNFETRWKKGRVDSMKGKHTQLARKDSIWFSKDTTDLLQREDYLLVRLLRRRENSVPEVENCSLDLLSFSL